MTSSAIVVAELKHVAYIRRLKRGLRNARFVCMPEKTRSFK